MSILDKFLNAMKLNDDDYDDDDFLDNEEDEYEEPRPKKSLFRKSGREEPLDDFDDDDDEPVMRKFTRSTAKTVSTAQPKTKPSVSSGTSKVSPIRTRKSTNDMSVCVVKPKSMEDAREITETLLANCTVVLNIEGIDLDLAQRIIDFTSGSCYAISGNLQKVSNCIFIVTPAAVDVSGDLQDILNGAFDIPSMNYTY